MKSSQLNFYLNQDDQFDLNKRLVDQDEILFCKARSNFEHPTFIGNSLIERMGEDALKICLVRKTDVPDLVFRKIKNSDQYKIDTLRSPVIEYSRCFVGPKFIRRGRLYFVKSFYDDHNQLVSKPDKFLSWANQIFKEAKKPLKMDSYRNYIGGSALNDEKHGFTLSIM